jgi:hypothetical protein
MNRIIFLISFLFALSCSNSDTHVLNVRVYSAHSKSNQISDVEKSNEENDLNLLTNKD